ncbi:MAG: hypothetical protein V3V05_10965 [Pontiella sp.]
MKKTSNWFKGLFAALLVAMVTVQPASAAPDYTALSTAITEGATAATAIVTVAIVAGFGIFVLIWGARKIKGALSAGG